jgi:hypothetical protein
MTLQLLKTIELLLKERNALMKLSIFLKFVNHDLVRRIAADLSQEDLQYNKNFMIRFSLQKIYQILSVKIRIYGQVGSLTLARTHHVT